MTLTTTANWRAAMSESGVRPVWLMRIGLTTGSAEGTDRLSFTSSSRPLFGYPASIARIAPMSFEKDPLEGGQTIGSPSITLKDDGAFRRLLAAYRLKNKTLDLYIGTEDLEEIDFARAGRFLIHNVAARPGSIEIAARDVMALLDSYEWTGAFVNQHPLEIISELLVRAGVPSSMFDAASLDPSDSANARISHYNISRMRKGVRFVLLESGVDGKEKASETIRELCQILGGTFGPREDGLYAFRRYSPSAGTQYALDRLLDVEEFEQVSTYDNLFNAWSMSFGKRGGGWAESWSASDADAITAATPPGGTDVPVRKELTSLWLNGIGYTRDDIAAADTAPFNLFVYGAGIAGFCGARISPLSGAFAQDSWAAIDADHPLYLKVTGIDAVSGLYVTEVFRCEDVWSFGGGTPYPGEVDYVYDDQAVVASVFGGGTATDDDHTWPNWVVFVVTARAQLGTSAQNFTGTFIHTVSDITIARDRVNDGIQRFGYGCPVYRMTLKPRRWDMQVGEFLTMPHPLGLMYGRADGFNNTDTFEVIRKELSLDRCEVLVAWVPPAYAGTIEDEPFDELPPAWVYGADAGSFIINGDGDLEFTQSGQIITFPPPP